LLIALLCRETNLFYLFFRWFLLPMLSEESRSQLLMFLNPSLLFLYAMY
jgi:hypothetical protein